MRELADYEARVTCPSCGKYSRIIEANRYMDQGASWACPRCGESIHFRTARERVGAGPLGNNIFQYRVIYQYQKSGGFLMTYNAGRFGLEYK
jgi:endogenous inhibitor of DNA gyrase (YacG/DUF329 family)